MTTQNSQTPAATPAASQQVSEPTGPSLTEILQFDPFAPPKDGSSDAGADDAAGAKDSGKPAVTPVAGSAAPAAVAPTAEEKAAADAAAAAAAAAKPDPIAAAIQTNTEAIRQMMARDQTQQPQTGADGKPVTTEPEKPKFQLGVPDAIINALASEDVGERKVAVHAIVNGVANAVWREANTLVQTVVQELVQSIPRFIEGHQTLAREQQQVASDFYGTYAVFNKSEFVPLMQNIGMQIAQEMTTRNQTPKWNTEMRDEIANRMFLLFPMLKTVHDAEVAKGNGKGKQPAATKPLPFVANGGGARPQAEPLNEMEAILRLP